MTPDQLTWFFALASVLAVSVTSLAGITVIYVGERRLRGALFILVSVAVGAMFGDAFIHLLPEAFKRSASPTATSLWILAGILLFFILEKVLRWRHEHSPGHVHPVGYMNLVADGLHNLLDGILIGTSYLVSVEVGLGTTLAVLLHEIPQEIGDFGVLLHAGFTTRAAVILNLWSALLAVLGTVVVLAAGVHLQQVPEVVLPIAAGSFIYIAGADLVPELHQERAPLRSLIQLLSIGLGIGLMFALTLIER